MLAPLACIVVGVLLLISFGMLRKAKKAGDATKEKTWKQATLGLLGLLVVCIAWLSFSQ